MPRPVRASDIQGPATKLRVLDLFSGIGSFSLGLERAGLATAAFCEINRFCRGVLAKHWPKVPCYHDVRELTADRLRADGISVDVICGGFPCQDLSIAGAGAGLDGRRSGLWSEIVRIAGDLRPRVLVVENVANLLAGPPEQPGAWFGRVLGDLAEIGFDAEWHCIPASAVGAPHIRDRVWIAAYPQHPDVDCQRSHRAQEHVEVGPELRDEQDGQPRPLRADVADADCQGLSQRASDARWAGCAHEDDSRHPSERSGHVAYAHSLAPIGSAIARQERHPWEPEPNVGRVAHGVAARVDRIKALGNSLVPQIAELIGLAILDALSSGLAQRPCTAAATENRRPQTLPPLLDKVPTP